MRSAKSGLRYRFCLYDTLSLPYFCTIVTDRCNAYRGGWLLCVALFTEFTQVLIAAIYTARALETSRQTVLRREADDIVSLVSSRAVLTRC